jgi:DNA repair protein RAD5
MALAAIGDVFQTSSRSNAKHAGRFVTLIVCPTSVIKKWQEEILTKTTLAEDQIIMYRDKERALYATMSEAEFEKVLREQDIKFILTSYEMIRADSNLLEGDDQYEHQVAMAKHHGTKLKAKQKFPLLLNHEWHRIILDEAHYICNPKSISTTQTCWALKGKRRWAASGTPINNNIGDIASLSQFIGVKEYDYNWWMDIQEEDKKVQDKEIALWRLQFVLQRGKEFLDLPPITEKLIRVAMSDRERKKYKQILDEIIRDYEHMEHHGDEMTRKERSNVLARIMKIR